MYNINHVFQFLFLCIFTFNSYAQQDFKKYLFLSYSEIDSIVLYEANKGTYERAIPYLKAAREKVINEVNAKDSAYALYTSDLAYCYSKIGKYTKALTLNLQAKSIREKVLGKEHPDYAESLSLLSELYYDMGDFDQAISLATQVYKIREKVLGHEHPDFTESINNLATFYYHIENYEKAIKLFVQAKNIRQKVHGNDHLEFANSLNNLSFVYIAMANFDKAYQCVVQAKNIREKVLGKEHTSFAASLMTLASLQSKIGNYNQALSLLLEAKNINEKVLGKENYKYAIVLYNLASIHYQLHNFDKALPFSIEAQKIYAKVLGKEHSNYATVIELTALVHSALGNYDEALPLMNQAKNIREKIFGKQSLIFATSLNSIAVLYNYRGQYGKAIPLMNQAKNIREKLLGKKHPKSVSSLLHLTSLYKQMGKYDEAWDVLFEAVNRLSSKDLEKKIGREWSDSLLCANYPTLVHFKSMITALDWAYLLLEKDSSISNINEKKIIVIDLATALLNKTRKQRSSEKDKLRVLSLSNLWLQTSLEVLNPIEHSIKAFNVSDQNKSVLLLQATKSEAAYHLGELPDSLVLRDKRLIKKYDETQAQLLEKRADREKDSLRNTLNHISQEMDDFNQLLKNQYPKYYKLKYQDNAVKAEDLQMKLSEKAAILEYVVADTMLHVFYLDKKEVQWYRTAIDKKVLSARIKTYHHTLSNYKFLMEDKEKAYNNFIAHAHWFYQVLLEPVLKDKENIHDLIIIPDGKLGHLPFETFLTKEAPQKSTDYHQLHYLIKDYNISYNYAASLWLENTVASAVQNNGQLLAMAANYELALDSTLRDKRLTEDLRVRAALKPLPAARKEVEALQEEFQGFFVYDTLASESLVKKIAPDFAIIHLAMHGILDAKRPMLSSLVFSENNDSIESNFWQAHEISKMKLNADLVVLSACETGFGKFETGNGIASLARSFMYAGASSLIVSLWQVNDFATSEIMKRLYNNLANGMKKHEALRHAKLDHMQSVKGVAAHPAFWSPFVHMGNQAPVRVQRKGALTLWLILLGFILLVLGGLLVMKKDNK
ncbi:MAG: CHAT domain-containing protein [Saprospiraceae bacterium]|nr:CHAT domain-containing protein [Saprospiraceae bacterium]